MNKVNEAIHKLATERLLDCIDRESDERAKQLDDLKFSTLDQWPSEIRAQREATGAPCLTIDKINQYVVQVVNDMRKNKPGVKVRPVDSAGDVKTANIFMGLVRHIEDASSADIAYAVAGEAQVRMGEGYFRIVTDYADSTSFDQEIYIKPIMDRFSVYLGQHQMPDGSDAEYGFIFEDVPKEKFKRDHPKAKTTSAELDSGNSGSFCDEKSIRVAEYFYFDYEDVEIVYLDSGETMELSEFEELYSARADDTEMFAVSRITDQRTAKKETVKWCKFTGAEILDGEVKDWAGKYIPIIKVTGKEAIVEGKRSCWGLVRPAKDSLRMYNYWASSITEKLALSPKVPFIGAVGQFATKQADWTNANRQNLAYLEYDAIDVNGMALPPPQRQAPAAIESAMIQQMSLIEHDIQTSLGMFKASVGESDPQQSGKAILALQQESDTGTSHFPDNLSSSIRYCGRQLIDLIPKIYDARKVARILGEDGESTSVQLDQNQPESMRQVSQMDGSIKEIYNLGVGKYDVTVTVGPSYNTKRMEMAEMLMKMNEGDPSFKQVFGDILFASMDWPDGLGQKMAERAKKMLPPQLQEGGQPQLPPEVQQQMQEMEQKLQELGQENQMLKVGQQESMAKIDLARQESNNKLTIKQQELGNELQLKQDAINKELILMQGKQGDEIQLKQMINADTTSTEIDTALAKIASMVQIHETRMTGMMGNATGTQGVEPQDNASQMAVMHNEFLQSVDSIMQALTAKKVATFPDGRTVTIQTIQ